MSLIGHLHYACKIAPQRRTFLRRMINLLCTFRRDDHPIRLNQEFHLELTWGQAFSQMTVQASCGRPLFKENCFVFHMLLYKLFTWPGPIAHLGRPLFKSWLNACLGRELFHRWMGSASSWCQNGLPSLIFTFHMQADTLQDPTCFEILIKCSKTDPFRVGCNIFIGWGGSNVVCPVVALDNFLAVCGPSPGPLFCFTDGRPLTCQLLSSTVQSLLRSAG